MTLKCPHPCTAVFGNDQNRVFSDLNTFPSVNLLKTPSSTIWLKSVKNFPALKRQIIKPTQPDFANKGADFRNLR